MRSGRFEPAWSSDGRQYFQLRWEDPPDVLTSIEMRRLEFLRYLVRIGRVTEVPVER